MRHDRDNQSELAGQSHQWVRDRLPDYATYVALGKADTESWHDIEHHVRGCTACRMLLDELVLMTDAVYNEDIPTATRYPEPDLSFLPQALPAKRPASPSLLEKAGRIVITFSAELVAALTQPALVKVERGQRLFTYGLDPDALPDLRVEIDVFKHDDLSGLGRVEVAVEVLTRDPLDQAESMVILRYDTVQLEHVTDELGCVVFDSVPLVSLPQIEIEVQPRRHRVK